MTFTYGASTDIPLVGDWDGDGVDTMAVYRPSTHKFYFRNSLSAGGAEFTSQAYGSPGDVPIVGDWNGDGVDTIGLYRTSNGAFYLRNDFGGGNAQVYVVNVGSPGDVGLSGDWDGTGWTRLVCTGPLLAGSI